MVKIACATEESLGAQALRPEYHELPSIPDTISYSACLMAEDLSARAIITPTHSGYTTRLISRYRPKAPIIALSPSAETIRRLCLTWGAIPLHVPELMSSRDFLERAVAAVKKAGMVRRGDRVVVTAGLPAGTGGITNLIKLAVVE
jgi:pyruvate kinase